MGPSARGARKLPPIGRAREGGAGDRGAPS